MVCDFQPDGAGQRCRRCGFFAPVAPGTRVNKQCVAAAPREAPADPTACVHRGQVVRAEPCASCNNSTIEVRVHACPLHGECTLYDYAARNPKLAGVAVCAKCPDRRAAVGGQRSEAGEEYAAPPAWKRIINFGRAIARDVANGRARRSAELVERIFDRQCARCPLFQRPEVGGQRPGEEEHGRRPPPGLRPPTSGLCTHCGCHVSPRVDELNKLHWQSEKCPLGKWPIERLNLIFYILPLAHTGRVWQWHVEQLRQRLHLFTGRRLVTIATPGPGNLLSIEPAQKVRAAFGSDADSIEFLERPNDPHHWETPAFREMLGLIADDRATRRHGEEANDDRHLVPSATFYGHAKGVRRGRFAGGIKLWCEAMYRHNLDRIDEVRELLAAYSAVGVAKIPQRPTAIAGPGWHFAGTFFWVNDQALFSRPGWNQIQDHSHAVEGYLATRFREDEAYCLAYDNPGEVYRASTWLDREAEKREGCKPRTRVSILVASCDYGRYLRECLESCLGQTYRCEVIVVDDASDDDSLDILSSFSSSPSVKIVSLTTRLGGEEARNHAARHATGDALLFVDSDNVLPADYVERMLEKLAPETPFVYPDLARFREVGGDGEAGGQRPEAREETADGRPLTSDLRPLTPAPASDLWLAPEWSEVDLTRANCADTCSLMWREMFERVGGWKSGFHFADWHLFLRLSKLGTPARAGVALGYREHGRSASAKLRSELTADELDDLRRRLVADALGQSSPHAPA